MRFSFSNRPRKNIPKTTGKFRTRKELVEEIKRMRNNGDTYAVIAKACLVSRSTVTVILKTEAR